MRITYEFDNGDTVIVEVEEAIGKWIASSRLKEAADDKRHHRWCYSLDAVNDKSNWNATRKYNPEDMLERIIREIEGKRVKQENFIRLVRAMEHLTDKQYELMHAIIFEKKTQAQFAREHNMDKGMISHRYKAAMKRIKKYF